MKFFLLVSTLFLINLNTWAAQDFSSCGVQTIIKNQSIVAQMVMMVTNFYSNAMNTLSATSKTSGCTWKEVVNNSASDKFFFVNNFEQIQEDVSKGEGKHWTTLMNFLGCQENSHDDLRQLFLINEDYLNVNLGGNTEKQLQLLSTFKHKIQQIPQLNTQCLI